MLKRLRHNWRKTSSHVESHPTVIIIRTDIVTGMVNQIPIAVDTHEQGKEFAESLKQSDYRGIYGFTFR